MITEEAIDILESYRRLQVKALKEVTGYEKEIREKNLEAFTMAIAALRKVKED